MIVLGGNANALSIARSLGRRGVAVYLLGTPAHLGRSRFCRRLRPPRQAEHEEPPQAWLRMLVGPDLRRLHGGVLLAGSDEGLELIARNHDRLEPLYRLDLFEPREPLWMLDKLATYREARAAGVPTPRFWTPSDAEEVAALRDELVYPLLVKPLYSHRFQRRFRGKFVVVDDLEELLAAYRAVRASGVEVMLVERIPGPDSELCSYFTYVDEEGTPRLDFTKRVIRRHPVGMGAECHGVTDRVPEVRDLTLRLLRHTGLRGLANAEYKRDPRDGQLKLIECNARFVATNCLLMASGVDLPAFVYGRLTGRPAPLPETYRIGVRVWSPIGDLKAYRELARAGELGLGGWLRSIARPQVFFVFRSWDPAPSLANGAAWVLWRVRRRGGRDVARPHTAARMPLERADHRVP